MHGFCGFFDIEFLAVRKHVAVRGNGRFFHHFTEVAGHRQLFTFWKFDGFDVKDIATSLCPGQPGGDSG